MTPISKVPTIEDIVLWNDDVQLLTLTLIHPVMSTIASLPPEIIYHIGAYLSIADNKILRYVCRFIGETVEPLALSSLAICLDSSQGFSFQSEMLTAYVERTTRATAYLRKLIISPVVSRQLRIANTWGQRVTVPALTPTRSTVNADESYQHFLQTFFALLMSLKNVNTVDWYLGDDISEQAIAGLFIFLSMPAIQKLSITFNRRVLLTESLLHFKRPWTVRELVLDETRFDSTSNMLATVALTKLRRSLIANCPNLEVLSLRTRFFNPTSFDPRLRDFLPFNTSTSSGIATTPPLPLKSLSLRGVRIHLDQAMLYHLRSLQYLHIRFPLTAPEYGDPVLTIMRTLREEKILLCGLNLNTTDVDNEVIDYLLSYANADIVQEIVFDNKKDRIYSSAADVSIFAKRFFSEVLPAVAGSLQTLEITTINRFDLWCFSPSYNESIKLCRKLESLCLSVDAEANNIAEVSNTSSLVSDRDLPEQCKLQEALKETKWQLPFLRSLEIYHIRNIDDSGLNIFDE